MVAFRWMPLLVVILFISCGRSTTSERVDVPPAEQQAKAMLQTYAETGQLDSSVVTLQEQLEAIKATDEAKGNALLSDFEQLKSASSPAKVKEKAQAMLSKL
jgi:hypothetical protein